MWKSVAGSDAVTVLVTVLVTVMDLVTVMVWVLMVSADMDLLVDLDPTDMDRSVDTEDMVTALVLIHFTE